MIYASQERAEQVAEKLNSRYGYALSKAVLIGHGWTVISDYRFGVTNPTPAQNAAYRKSSWAVQA